MFSDVCCQEKTKQKHTDPKIKAYNETLALVSSAQLRVGGVLHVEHPAAHQHRQPCQEQVLDTHEGDPSLSRSERHKHVELKEALPSGTFVSLIKPTCWGATARIQISKTNKRRPKSQRKAETIFLPYMEVSHSLRLFPPQLRAELWRIK